MFYFPQRDISCSAKSCPYVVASKSIIPYTIICPLNQIYYYSCDSKWLVTIYGHNCIKVVQANFLIIRFKPNIVKHLSKYFIEKHDTVMLTLRKINKRPNKNVLQTIQNVVKINRRKLLIGCRIDIPDV